MLFLFEHLLLLSNKPNTSLPLGKLDLRQQWGCCPKNQSTNQFVLSLCLLKANKAKYKVLKLNWFPPEQSYCTMHLCRMFVCPFDAEAPILRYSLTMKNLLL